MAIIIGSTPVAGTISKFLLVDGIVMDPKVCILEFLDWLCEGDSVVAEELRNFNLPIMVDTYFDLTGR